MLYLVIDLFWHGSGHDPVLLSCTAAKDTYIVVQITSAGMQAASKRYVPIWQKQPSALLFPRGERDRFLVQKWCNFIQVLPPVLAQALELLRLPLRDAVVCFWGHFMKLYGESNVITETAWQ